MGLGKRVRTPYGQTRRANGGCRCIRGSRPCEICALGKSAGVRTNAIVCAEKPQLKPVAVDARARALEKKLSLGQCFILFIFYFFLFILSRSSVISGVDESRRRALFVVFGKQGDVHFDERVDRKIGRKTITTRHVVLSKERTEPSCISARPDDAESADDKSHSLPLFLLPLPACRVPAPLALRLKATTDYGVLVVHPFSTLLHRRGGN